MKQLSYLTCSFLFVLLTSSQCNTPDGPCTWGDNATITFEPNKTQLKFPASFQNALKDAKPEGFSTFEEIIIFGKESGYIYQDATHRGSETSVTIETKVTRCTGTTSKKKFYTDYHTDISYTTFRNQWQIQSGGFDPTVTITVIVGPLRDRRTFKIGNMIWTKSYPANTPFYSQELIVEGSFAGTTTKVVYIKDVFTKLEDPLELECLPSVKKPI